MRHEVRHDHRHHHSNNNYHRWIVLMYLHHHQLSKVLKSNDFRFEPDRLQTFFRSNPGSNPRDSIFFNTFLEYRALLNHLQYNLLNAYPHNMPKEIHHLRILYDEHFLMIHFLIGQNLNQS